MNKIGWLFYRNDSPDRPGWHVAYASPELPDSQRRKFLTLVEKLPLEPFAKEEPIYFGALEPEALWLGVAQPAGTDGLGRPGGWQCFGFHLRRPAGSLAPLAWTRWLWNRIGQASTSNQETPDIDASQLPVPVEKEAPPGVSESTSCILLLPHGVDGSAEYLDCLLAQKSQNHTLTYVFPVSRHCPGFSLVGLDVQRLCQDEVPVVEIPMEKSVPQAPRSGKLWFVVLLLLLICSLIAGGVAFSKWQESERSLIFSRREAQRLQQALDDLDRIAKRLANRTSEQSVRLEDILRKSPKRIQNMEIKVETTTFSFTPETAQEIASDILHSWKKLDEINRPD